MEDPVASEKISVIHENWVRLTRRDLLLQNGSEMVYEVVEGRSGAGVLVITSRKTLIVNRQYRFPIRRWIYDIPGGGAEPGESLEETARRECAEEVGIRPLALEPLIVHAVDPTRADDYSHIYVCRSYEEVEDYRSDPTEPIERAEVSFAEFRQLVEAGEIVDPTLLLAWYAARDKGYIDV